MSITVNKTSGVVQATIQDGAVDDSTSLALLGKNYSGYGEKIAENFLRLLENFANNTPPNGPVQGQLWYKSSTGTLYAYDGAFWQALVNQTVSDSNPSVAIYATVTNVTNSSAVVTKSTTAGTFAGTLVSGQIVRANASYGGIVSGSYYQITAVAESTVTIQQYNNVTNTSASFSGSIANFTGSVTGSVLTVTSAGGILTVGTSITGTGISAGTHISSLGTGTGGLGTYNLNNSMSATGSITISIAGMALPLLLTVESDSNIALGDMWWDSANLQLKVYNGGATWITVGPSTAAGLATSGQLTVSVNDNTGNPPPTNAHSIIKEWLDGTLIAIYSKDTELTPSPAIAGFTTIKPGINFSTAGNILKVYGTATNADTLDSLDSTDFLRANVSATTTATISILNDNGIILGTTSDFVLSLPDGINTEIKNNNNNGNVTITTSGTGQVLTASSYTPTSNYSLTTKTYVDTQILSANATVSATSLFRDGTNTITGTLLPAVTNSVTLGNSSYKFNNIFATTFTGNLSSTTVSSTSGVFSGNVTAGNITVADNITVTSLTVNGASSIRNIVPQSTNAYNIGSAAYTFANVYATAGVVGSLYTDNLRYANGAAYTFDNANATNAVNAINLLVSGTYRTAVTTATSNTVVARDNSADIYASNFRASADMYATVFHGTATTSTYADLAENYASDDEYEVGTVVMVGGESDITAAQPGVRALGVISENPAYLMNSHEIGQPVALKGKVPVKVSGIVKKGERLISGENGVAIAVSSSHADTFAISLETSDDTEIKLIQATII